MENQQSKTNKKAKTKDFIFWEKIQNLKPNGFYTKNMLRLEQKIVDKSCNKPTSE